jgi:tetratricopeptide (TPR) repeat protein
VELLADHSRLAREWLERVEPSGEAALEMVFLLAETYRREEDFRSGVAALLRLQPRLTDEARAQARAFEAEFRLRENDPRGWDLLRPLLESDRHDEVLGAIQILQGLERWQEVERATAAALERFPEERDLLFTRAAALERLDREAESEEIFRSLLDSDPGDAASANYLGYMWADAGRNLEEALALVSRAVALDPENPAYLDSLGWVHYRLSDLDQAAYWLRRAVASGGRDGTILAHLGEVLLERGELEEARRLLERALDLGCEEPDHVRRLLESAADVSE